MRGPEKHGHRILRGVSVGSAYVADMVSSGVEDYVAVGSTCESKTIFHEKYPPPPTCVQKKTICNTITLSYRRKLFNPKKYSNELGDMKDE